jgi:hypothetical protein
MPGAEGPLWAHAADVPSATPDAATRLAAIEHVLQQFESVGLMAQPVKQKRCYRCGSRDHLMKAFLRPQVRREQRASRLKCVWPPCKLLRFPIWRALMPLTTAARSATSRATSGNSALNTHRCSQRFSGGKHETRQEARHAWPWKYRVSE